MFLRPLQKMQDFMFHKNKPMSSYPLPYKFHVVELKLCYLVDGVCTLVDVVIVDPIQIDLVLQAIFSRGVATTIMVQTKDDLYHD